ncbi:hypothetical protein F5B21DRAFT_87775 [Xylaria acuta]|nr:hypothetical protein F5B21DRAFT_87775 [Xylaria acuta]
MSNQGGGPDSPIHLDGFDPMQTLENRLDALLFPLPPHHSPPNVPSPFYHGLSANLLEIRVVLPSVSYLRFDSGTYLGSVPRDILESYTSRAIADAQNHSAILTSPLSPNRSAWWMAGDVLRLIGDSLDRKVIGWWETARTDDYSPQPPLTNGQSPPFCLFSSDRFSLVFRTLDHRIPNLEAGESDTAVDLASAAAYENEISRLRAEIQQREENASQQDTNCFRILADLESARDRLRRYEEEEEAAARRNDEAVSRLEAAPSGGDEAIRNLTGETQHHTPGESSTSGAGETAKMSNGPGGGEVAALQARLDEAERTNGQHVNHIAKLRDIIRRHEYNTMTVANLREECKARGVEMPSNAVKATIIDALVSNDKERHVNEPTKSEIDNGVS